MKRWWVCAPGCGGGTKSSIGSDVARIGGGGAINKTTMCTYNGQYYILLEL